MYCFSVIPNECEESHCLYCHSEPVEESLRVSALFVGCFYENVLSSAKIFSIKRRYARTTRLKHDSGVSPLACRGVPRGFSVTPSVSRGPPSKAE